MPENMLKVGIGWEIDMPVDEAIQQLDPVVTYFRDDGTVAVTTSIIVL